MLEFQPVTIDSLKEIDTYFPCQSYRTCDFTEGGLFMWASYFNYEYAVYKETLFVKGFAEDDMQDVSFAVPIGKMTLPEAIALLKHYCDERNIPLILSAVPQQAAVELQEAFACEVTELRDWADYLYDAEALASLKGRKYNKKRNRVNKFKSTWPDFEYQPLTPANLPEVKDFFDCFERSIGKDSSLFDYEESMVNVVLDNYKSFNFEGGLLKAEGRTVAFSIGEIVNDTLFVHIEKAFREYDGGYEVINQLFADDITRRYPQVAFINREEDVGDEGLRQAKLSYNPVEILNKYNIKILAPLGRDERKVQAEAGQLVRECC